MKKEQEQWLNLVRIAKADGNLDELEMKLVLRFAAQYGISDEEIEQLLELDEPQELSGLNAATRVKYFYQALTVATVDFELSADEEQVMRKLGSRLGFADNLVDQALDFARKNGKPDLEPQALEQLFAASE